MCLLKSNDMLGMHGSVLLPSAVHDKNHNSVKQCVQCKCIWLLYFSEWESSQLVCSSPKTNIESCRERCLPIPPPDAFLNIGLKISPSVRVNSQTHKHSLTYVYKKHPSPGQTESADFGGMDLNLGFPLYFDLMDLLIFQILI